MSYCRWSCDSYRCDLYCYEDVSGGWTTHVAGNKIRDEDAPGRPEVADDAPFEDWWAHSQAMGRWLEANEQHRTPLGLPHDGETFNDPTLEDFRARVLYLREVGYHVPDNVLTTIDEEIAESR